MSEQPTKAYVLPVPGHEAEIDELKKLIQASGCLVVCADDPLEHFEQCIQGADVLVILICPETMNNDVVNAAVILASRLGRRIVGVWSKLTTTEAIPKVLDQHGDANIRLYPAEVATAVCQGEAIWTTPDGGPRPTPKTPRHKRR